MFTFQALAMCGSASLMVVVCLIVLVKEFWILGPIMTGIGMGQILFICGMGAAFENSCWAFLQCINSLDWYLLTPRCRKYFWVIIQVAQNPKLNTMGGIYPSNLNTFLTVRE